MGWDKLLGTGVATGLKIDLAFFSNYSCDPNFFEDPLERRFSFSSIFIFLPFLFVLFATKILKIPSDRWRQTVGAGFAHGI